MPRVFTGDHIGFLQNANRAQGNVFQVSDRRRHQIQATVSSSVLNIWSHEVLNAVSLTCPTGRGGIELYALEQPEDRHARRRVVVTYKVRSSNSRRSELPLYEYRCL